MAHKIVRKSFAAAYCSGRALVFDLGSHKALERLLRNGLQSTQQRRIVEDPGANR